MIQLPFAPQEESQESRCCYTFGRFYKILRGYEPSARVLKAIGLTSEEVGFSPVYVARILVEHGLRAPKPSFPHGFIDFVESKSGMDPWAAGAMTYAQNKLAKFWQIEMTCDQPAARASFQ